MKPKRRARRSTARTSKAVKCVLLGCLIAAIAAGTVLTYYYFSFSRIIDARLHGERERSLPRVFARPLALRRGEALSALELIARLNDLGYAQRPSAGETATQPT